MEQTTVKRRLTAKAKFILRFNLGAGKNHQKWKLTYPSGTVKYFEPNEVTIVLSNCKLRNSPATSKKIFGGGEKVVCAWIEADGADVLKNLAVVSGVLIGFNPRICPNWQVDGENGDNAKFKTIMTTGRKLYAVA